ADRLRRGDAPLGDPVGVPAHHRPRARDARRLAEPRRGAAHGHQPAPRLRRGPGHRARARRRRGVAPHALLPGVPDGGAGVRADAVRRGGARHPGHRRRLGPHRGVPAPPHHARGQAERSCRMNFSTRISAVLAVLLAALIALPLVVTSNFAYDILIRILLFAFIGTSWNLLGGYAKQFSLGHAAFFGLGAYTSSLLQINYGVSPWLGMLAGGVVAMLASLPIGWLCFRLRGPYFTIAT